MPRCPANVVPACQGGSEGAAANVPHPPEGTFATGAHVAALLAPPRTTSAPPADPLISWPAPCAPLRAAQAATPPTGARVSPAVVGGGTRVHHAAAGGSAGAAAGGQPDGGDDDDFDNDDMGGVFGGFDDDDLLQQQPSPAQRTGRPSRRAAPGDLQRGGAADVRGGRAEPPRAGGEARAEGG